MVHRRRRPESVLRCKAAALLKKKEEDGSIFDQDIEDGVPKFDPKEIREGIFLGSGGFCTVTEVSKVTILDEQSDCDGSSQGYGDRPVRGISRLNSSMLVQNRDFISTNFLRNGQARYAIKKLTSGLYKQSEDHFMAGVLDLAMEVKFLAVLQHPHIIKMRAVSSTHPCSVDFFLVLDRLYETLTDRLASWKKQARKLSGLGSMRDVLGRKKDEEFAKRLMVAYDICSALHFLHANKVIYRDLKPDNIGFDIRDDVKIFDFGLAKELSEKLRYRNSDTYKLTAETGSPRYMAPEIAIRRPYNQKADVYSFALLFWQICELKVPYDDYDMHLLTCNVFHGSKRPPINPRRPEGLQNMLKNAWHTKLERRPECEEILRVISMNIKGFGGDDLELDYTNRSEKSAAAAGYK